MRWGLLVILTLSLASCSSWNSGWQIIEGNAAFQRGDFQRAALGYLSVARDPGAADVVRYDLGNVYNALGETAMALSVWSQISQPGFDELAYRLAFNRGYLLYQTAQYAESCEQFRLALLMKPSSLDAKKNLELALLKTQTFGANLPARTRTVENQANGDSQKALLDYINRLEGTRWSANNKPESSSRSSSDW